ncbi:quinoprotein dehydrogenase-associated SoxYZ-like carrier [Rubellimicrobium sp. CFH 75288]|uniref:quinoprotein dehydrogenase-associated SoxYZ-like carrier n=1 Tax=Rubellimicrobium sp. CFH 75288 TaxID=2697034 RepID=UPI0014136D7F|nr:quinoprotein dehydrogenase-associated SoxYZ-like carrier [Rubellimicrobium sp. CFH 75288]NAZ35830.1 quinoprotein dehydrogenase-associated SoxYZ-like carrier [Rubellimicrobium sp. CFH 75288]
MLRLSFAAVCLLSLPLGALAEEPPNPLVESAAWDDLAGHVLGEATALPAGSALQLEAPVRAEDAATVPVRLVQPADAPRIEAVTLVVDENPVPIAAEITFGEAMSPLDFELRLRVDAYSNVRAVAFPAEGEPIMTGAFVKASGGCSAPATRSPAEVLASLGEMRLREFGRGADGRAEAQIMIRHPQYSGLQRDQVTQYWIPPHYIERLEVWQGEDRLFTLTGGISISENPVFRFRFADNGAPAFRVRVEDTEGHIFERLLNRDGPA